MGKPRMILLIRHAQSEGNKNRDIHQYIPDHRVKLTADGILQAEEAGRRLRSMLKPDDTIQFFTSPYRRTRETTNSILSTLTSDDPEQGPSPFPRHKITVYEEPRLREQDFGNFQPCSNEMERMWQERADYGHFFYRIPDGESAADAYDRVSGFNESLWRQFGDPDFPSVCVLVTHGLMTRIFLMKWYHWSVEYFEDLRNVNHCEFIIMKHNPDNDKYKLENELRTWSNFSRQRELTKGKEAATPKPARKWGGCVDGCDHKKFHLPHRVKRQNTIDEGTPAKQAGYEKEILPVPQLEEDNATPALRKKSASSKSLGTAQKETPASKDDGVLLTPSSSSVANDDFVDRVDTADNEDHTSSRDASDEEHESSSPMSASPKKLHSVAAYRLQRSHRSTPQGNARPASAFATSLADLSNSDEADESDYFDTNIHQMQKRMSHSEPSRSRLSQVDEAPPAKGSITKRGSSSKLARKNSASKLEKQWQKDSGMRAHKRADALGDVDEDEDDASEEEKEIEALKEADRKSLSEVY